jgi:lipopolysaccharide/colanic/teichoic acid biosynthesis glycosyltransferase
MSSESVQLKSQASEVTPPVWGLLASKADYLDSDAPWLSQTILSPDVSYERSSLWTAIAFVERIAAATALLFCTPLLIVVAIVVVMLSRRCPFIAHRRVGRNGRELWVIKLRTMWGNNGCMDKPGLVEFISDEPATESKSARDARITSRFALFCRKYSIDELPQLWQVVRGEMALVGPRPLTAGEIAMHYGSSAALLASKRPGLTGLWQVKGRSRLNYHQRRRLDVFMVQHWSLRLYFSILLVTPPRVLLGRDAW